MGNKAFLSLIVFFNYITTAQIITIFMRQLIYVYFYQLYPHLVGLCLRKGGNLGQILIIHVLCQFVAMLSNGNQKGWLSVALGQEPSKTISLVTRIDTFLLRGPWSSVYRNLHHEINKLFNQSQKSISFGDIKYFLIV